MVLETKNRSVLPSGCLRPVVLFLIAISPLIILIFIFGSIDLIKTISWDLKPYANLTFEKVNLAKPNQIICPTPYGSFHRGDSEVFFSYDKSSLYVYDSLSMINLINTINFDGEIEKIQIIDDAISTKSKLLFFIQLKNGSKNIIKGFYIEPVSLKYYFLHKYLITKYTEKQLTDKVFWDSLGSIENLMMLDKLPENYLVLKNATHPGRNIFEMFSFETYDSEYMTYLFDQNLKKHSIVINNKKTNKLTLIDLNGNKKSEYTIGVPFIYNYNIYNYLSSALYIFTGEYYLSLYFESDKLVLSNKVFVDKEYNLSKSFFVNIFEDHSRPDFTQKVFNGYKTYSISCHGEFGQDCIEHKGYQNAVFLKPYNIATKNNGILLADDEYVFRIPYKPLSYTRFSIDSKQIVMENPIGFKTIALSIENNNNGDGGLIILAEDYYLASISGIDEPVDEAHVTYEDNKLTVYFMNRNSVYRWQNSEIGIDNLKLRKLDIKPEPIVTTKQ